VATPALPADLEHRRLELPGGLGLHVALAGPEDGPLVLLLHGFPEFWYGWKNQLGPLAAAGFRVAAPDQRGYNDSDKPAGLAAYTREALARDVVQILDTLGRRRAIVVGHDWGGAVAWWMALQHPERLERLVVLNIPHPVVHARALRSWAQLRRSWYILMFQLSGLAEWLLSQDRHRRLVELMRAGSRGTLSDADLDRYREAYSKPGALKAMLSWYRAVVRLPSGRLRTRRVERPALVIWGARDPALGVEMAAPSAERCDRGRLRILDRAGHFVTHDAWEQVNHELLDFLGPAADYPAETRPG
jgi:pimeloyl-ACP methyl ester carboxylesterase